MHGAWQQRLQQALLQQHQQGLYRSPKVLQSPQGVEVVQDGRELLAFCSNDYLGLAADIEVRNAWIFALQDYGNGSAAAHLLSGHSEAHQQLEQALAEWLGYPRVLLFSTGYMANLAVATALCQRGDCILQDKLNHASLIDAAQLSGAKLLRYQHNNREHFNQRLQQSCDGERLLMTDGVFSMDGDMADLPWLSSQCEQNGVLCMVDDAHGVGVLGEHGRGTLEYFGLGAAQVPILMGTLGKAMGVAGAFVAADELIIEQLIQQARSYIFTTASPPAQAVATRKALELMQQQGWRRERLQDNIQTFREGAEQLKLPLMRSWTPIQPLRVGEASASSAISQALWEQGFLVPPVRPPTVPVGQARLRVTLSALHKKAHIEALLTALDQLWPESLRST